jgi:hypothetical protein
MTTSHLRRLKNLEMLELCETNISDAGLNQLRELSRLTVVYVHGTKVTENGARELEAALPGCCVIVAAPPGIIS